MSTISTRGAEEEVFETPDAGDTDFAADAAAGGRSEWAAGVNTGGRKVADAEILPSTMPPRAAFEVFMGKSYAGARQDMSDIIGASSVDSGGAVYAAEGFRKGGATGGVGTDEALRRAGESPMQRLVRLREETALLAADLEEMSKDKGTAKGPTGDDSAGGYALWSAMAKETESLTRQLAQLSGDPKYKHVLASPPGPAEGEEVLQQRLSEGLVKALESLRAAPAGSEQLAQVSSVDQGAESVTYELFLKEAADARARDAGRGVSEIEARIASLEAALGGADGVVTRDRSSEKGQVAPLAEVVASLESRVSLLEPGKLDSLKQKAQLAKAELDSLSKSSASFAHARDASRKKKVEEAFQTLQSVQAITVGLPALVDRLRALESLHLASASFAKRLEQVEVSQSELGGLLKGTKEELEATRQSSAENVAIVDENVRALDRRLAAVAPT